VGDEDDGLAGLVELLEDAHDLFRRARVEVAGRLVGEDDGRIGDQGAGDRHPLLLAPGELRGVMVLAAGEADPREGFARAAGALGGAQAQVAVEHRQLDVLDGPGARQQVEALEDEADLRVADLGPLVAVETRDVDAVQPVGARGRPVEAAQDVHERRLAGARGAHDGDQLPGLDREVDPLQGVNLDLAHLVDLRQVADLDDRVAHGFRTFPSTGRRACGRPSGKRRRFPPSGSRGR
jgi:hypothetical protein